MNKLLAALLLLITTTSFAQTDSIPVKDLSEVVVTGQYRPQSVRNSVYQVRVINNERIRLSGATNVQQVLDNQLGIRFSNDNTLGTSDIQLMGMSGRNVKILQDGVPLVDRGDVRESLNQVDVNNIERIEIVEGPLSVSYGSDALAGVINIITKKPSKDRFSVMTRAQEETAGDEYYPFSYKGSHNQSAGFSLQNKGWSFSAGGSHNDHDGFGGDDFGRQKTWKPKEQWLGHAQLGYNLNHFNIYYRYDGLNEAIVSRGRMGQTFTAIDQRYISDRNMHQLQSDWRINDRLQWNNIISFTDYERRTKTFQHDFTTGKEELTTGAGEQDVSKFNSFVFRPTLQYYISSKASLQTGLDINRESASGERISGSPVITDYALFVSSEIKPTAAINLRPGLRFIHNSVYDAPPVIPSINAKFNLSKQSALRVAYAYGFRSPALRELYFDFHDANHDIVGNPNLKAEHSNSFSGSYTWTPLAKTDNRFSGTLTGFYNSFHNLINYGINPANPAQFITINIDRFKTTGGTIEGNLDGKNFSAGLGFSYIGRFNDLSENETLSNEDLPKFVWSPELNSTLIYRLPKSHTSLSLFYKFTGKRPGYTVITNNSGQEEAQLTEIESYNWADFTITQPILKYFTVNAGIKNLFDVKDVRNTSTDSGGHSDGGPVAIGYGRSYFLGLNFQWNKK